METADALSVDGKLRLSQEGALAAIAAVSSSFDSDESLTDFVVRLSATISRLTGATRAAFWRLGPLGTLALQVGPHGFPDASPVYTVRLRLGGSDVGAIDRSVFFDELELSNGTSVALDQAWHDAGLTDVTNSIAASWTVGQQRIGAVAAYDSPQGFTANDLWLLRLLGMVAGLLWKYRESEDEPGQTSMRIEQAMGARRQLLSNIAAGGDEARRRFASALNDDSLQLLTGAELQVERIRSDPAMGHQAVQLEQLRLTLLSVEESLSQLLTSVSPEPLPLPGDLGSNLLLRPVGGHPVERRSGPGSSGPPGGGR